jgi:hypothetical protein
MRKTVGMMLFVWLLSLGIGVANACLAQQDHGHHEHVSLQHPGVTSALPAGHEFHSGQPDAGQLPAQDDGQAPDKLVCSDFCAAAQSAPVKNPLDWCTALDLAPVPGLCWQLVAPIEQASRLATLERPIGSEPPLTIRFMRFTI